MNKKLLLIFIFLIGITFMPIVNAEEIPREGVTYFLQYPDGTEDVTESYDEAIDSTKEEKLIFEGTTNLDGQVILEGISNQGSLRVKEVVPEGYSTDAREYEINLNETKQVEFTNHSGLINPKTGSTILFIVLSLATAVAITIMVRKNKKAAAALIPVLLIALVSKVNAEDNNLVINVKDAFGQPQSNVRIQVYAKPKIDAKPAIKFDANGGKFFDGKELMYFRIPYEGCNSNEFFDSLSDEQYNYLAGNDSGAYRNGYYRSFSSFPDTLSNGTTIPVEWNQDSNAKLVTYSLNGETIDFYGTKMDKYYLYFERGMYPPTADYIEEQLNNKENYIIGYDTNSSCSNYDQYGIPESIDSGKYNPYEPKEYYCWHSKPDGIYINDIPFIGNKDNCFSQWSKNHSYGSLYLNNYVYGYTMEMNNIYDDESYLYENYFYLNKLERVSYLDDFIVKENYAVLPSANASLQGADAEQKEIQNVAQSINKIEVVYHGQTIISINSNDLGIRQIERTELDCDGRCRWVTKTVNASKINNNTKLEQLRDHLSSYYEDDACYKEETIMLE